MKILCETQVIHRNVPQHMPRAPKSKKATLAIGYRQQRGNGECDGQKLEKEVEIIHFPNSNQKGNGIRYKIRDNVEKCFTKFVKDGKVTISFKSPPDDLMIKCDPIQLKGFLQTLRLGLEGKESMNLRLNVMATTAIPTKSQPQVKLTIRRRDQYPTQGFPSTLKLLYIIGIELTKITFSICSLRHLTVLDLSENKIEEIPLALGRLNLVTLNLRSNKLHLNKCWKWLSSGRSIQQSLRELDLSENELTRFPKALIKLQNLVTLKLNYNHLERLPFGIRQMHGLRYLHLANNKLISLPATFNSLRLDTLDIWENAFQPQLEYNITYNNNNHNNNHNNNNHLQMEKQENDHLQLMAMEEEENDHLQLMAKLEKNRKKKKRNQYSDSMETNPWPLWLLASNVVHRMKINYSNDILPWDICDFLQEGPQCPCGRLCFNTKLYERAAPVTFENIRNLVFSRDRLIYVDMVLCGPNCIGHRQMLATT